ncbi:M16 family metallopeptidase [Lentiprolixibacter aurantiacus]|uniref:Pitrilysin family protein n=1 Tax=Lentiprolixibacter aurantiacus TaxID=2993939 RepID=A0AAE3MKW2_9FLAO|nr:pitrilysin family protein [Lentiprolixibacter aurantiacus]MCX2718779.1 pitrilysin family protein [Lentiprolixibacter aurantiacus]
MKIFDSFRKSQFQNLKRNAFCLLALILSACQNGEDNSQSDFRIEYEKFELDNGLDVIFHIDRTDPVVAVALTAHVGSAREKAGRTGFAHLFEHLLFLESENLGKGGLDKLSARIGGSGANGSTSRDRTNYFQTVPSDALEKMIWAEADKIGWFINTVTEPVLAKEKEVVKNEKRLRVDNQPYGHTQYVIDKALYPEGHPYNWQVIGSLEDLQNATLEDVKDFYRKWYGPNNVTLVISGDFDPAQAKEWVEKYFNEIPRGEEVAKQPKQSAVINKTMKFYHEDNFARLPELTVAWPTVPLYHKDYYPLVVLTKYLTEGKKAPFTQVLVNDLRLTSEVRMFSRNSELAGQAQLSIRAFEEIDLDSVQSAINKAFNQFEKSGISEQDLDRIKAGQEADFYGSLSSVLGKGFQLAQYNIFADDPGYINEDIRKIQEVTSADVIEVYEKYIKDQPYVATSFVPKSSALLALEGSVKANVVEEPIVLGAENSFDPSLEASYEKTPSSFDRSVEPPYGSPPSVKIPEVWQASLTNGLEVLGIESNEVPLIQMNLVIDGGQLLDSPEKVGVANMVAEMMTRGTETKTPVELENAIAQLGASIRVSSGKDEIRISATTLARNYEATIDLIQEILTEPRWDNEELELVRQKVINALKQQEANPNTIASNTFDILIYGKDNILSKNSLGDQKGIESVTMADLKNYYDKFLAPNVAKFYFVGSISQEKAISSLSSLQKEWKMKEVTIPKTKISATPKNSTVYFYDVPNAKQSVLFIGYPALTKTDADYYPAVVMNYILGGGGFASQLTQELREKKGYTYGIGSYFSGDLSGTFAIRSNVRSNITLEASQAIKNILEEYGPNYSFQDLETTQSALIKGNARAFETARAKLNMLENVGKYNWPVDYLKQQEAIINEMTVEEVKNLAAKYINPNKMYWLVVGDAATQLERMKELGFGEPVLINQDSARK